MFTLRPYQEALIAGARANFQQRIRSQLLVLPTGGGKTVCFSFMASQAVSKGLRVWVLAHRQELLFQISSTLGSFNVPHAFICAGLGGDSRQPVQVASVATLAKRLHRYQPPDLIIIDEAHHAIRKSLYGQIIDACPRAKIIGVTATPIRLSGEGLGEIFDTMVQGPQTSDLIEHGALSPYRLFAPSTIDVSGVRVSRGDFVRSELEAMVDKPQITGDAVTHYRRLASGKRAVAFCVSIDHARHVADQFTSAGIPARSLDGTMDRLTRGAVIDEFKAGRVLVLTSCDLISEGFDLPAIEAAILLRPTQSLALYLQQVGRALRTFPGKTEAIILDHAGNRARHGFPDDPREWSLDGQRKRKAGTGESVTPVKDCPQCFAKVATMATHCRCGYQFPPPEGRSVEQVDGELQEISRDMAKHFEQIERKREQGRAKTEAELINIGRMRGMKRPEMWARYVMRARAAKQARA